MSFRDPVPSTAVVVAACAHAPHALPVDARLNDYATCDGGDVVGTHLCFAVKEGIITSVGLQLVDDRTARTGIAVHVGSVDASPPRLPKGATSAVSVTYAYLCVQFHPLHPSAHLCRAPANGLLLPDFYSGATGLSGCFSEGFSLRCSQSDHDRDR